MTALTFVAVLQKRGPAAAVVLDGDQVAKVGCGVKRFPVRATVDGYSWRGSVSRMRGEFLLGLSREVREAAGVEAGDEVTVEISLDEEERTVEVPDELAKAMSAEDGAKASYDGLAYTHRKEFARWIADAKRADTRDRRIAKTLELLREGKTLG